jgi:hypothetical protein
MKRQSSLARVTRESATDPRYSFIKTKSSETSGEVVFLIIRQ